MFRNVGKKLQTFAKVFTWIGIVLGGLMILSGLLLLISAVATSEASTFAVVPIMLIYGLVFPLAFWVSGLTLYGFGQLIQDTRTIRDKMPEPQNTSDSAAQQ